MADLKALQCLKEVQKIINSLEKPPGDFSLQKTELYATKCKKILTKTRDTITKVTSYIKDVNERLTDVVKSLHDFNKNLEDSMVNALATIRKHQAYLENSKSVQVRTSFETRIEARQMKRAGQQLKSVPADYNRQQNKQTSKALTGYQKRQGKSDMKRLMILENIAKENVLLQKLIVQSQEVFEETNISESELNALEECLSRWKEQAELTLKSEDEIKREMAKRDKERMERHSFDDDGDGCEIDDDNSDDNDDNIDVNDDDREVQEDKKKREMEEKNRRDKEEEERMKALEQNKRREEENKRQKDLQEEEKRKRLIEEKRKQEEEIKKQLEEDRKRRLDLMNWSFIVYRVKSDEVGGCRQIDDTLGLGEVSGERDKDSDVRCVVSASDGSIRKTDIRCILVDVEFTEHDNPTKDDERIVSPIVNLQSGRGEIKAEAPIQVFLPHIYVNDDINETVVKHSENGEEWIANPPIKPVKLVGELDTRTNDNLVGMEINSFTNLRMVVVSRQKRSRFSVGEVGGSVEVSSDDDDGMIHIVIPTEAFDTDIILETKIQPVPEEVVDSLLTKGERVTRVILIGCSQPPAKSLSLDIERLNNGLSKTGSTRYTTIKTGDTWEFADAEFKDQTNSVELPPHRRAYSIIEIDMPQDVPSEQALRVAEVIHTRINSIPVKMILKQNTADPHDAVIQCIHSNHEGNVLQDLLADGYSIGPNVSCEIFLQEGTKIDVTCFGNVQFVNEQKVGLLFLAYMNSAKRRVTFEAKNKYFEREYRCYSGGIIYKFSCGRSLDGLTDMMTTFKQQVVLPKGEEDCVIQKTVGNLTSEMIGLAKFLSLQLVDNCSDWQVVLTNLCGRTKAIIMRESPKSEDGTEIWGDQELCRRIIVAWMKSKPKFNKLAHIRNVLVSSGYPQLAAPCTDYVNYFKDKMNDAVIYGILDLVKMDPVQVSDRLGLSNDEIDGIFIEFHDETLNKTAALIYGWRFTENALKAGTRAVEVLRTSLGL